MAVGWFLVPYKRLPHEVMVTRYCAVDDLTSSIAADGGEWSETEVLGQFAIVKVRASAATLNAVAGLAGTHQIPVSRLEDLMSSLTNQQKTVLRNKVTSLGYSLAEFQARFPDDLSNYTFRDLLEFVARRRRKVRYDRATDAIIDDGPEQPVRSVNLVNSEVADG